MQSNEQKLRFLGASPPVLPSSANTTNKLHSSRRFTYLLLSLSFWSAFPYSGWLPRPFVSGLLTQHTSRLRLNIELWRLIRNLLVQVPDRHEIAEETKEKEELQSAPSNGVYSVTSSGRVSYGEPTVVGERMEQPIQVIRF